ncbi:MAG TPA: hypothetical protein PLU90_12565 [Planctomycetota bacterium]|nr:hypothetical protein [Planctomycetota bacterium]HOR68416.1 hypothetical protein [Planctomycetota bacterium]HQG87194.1 hypothetical protein [Planctomycetota bacterium]HQM61099.1 hypothetical protein [Planctomycetota bacterium]
MEHLVPFSCKGNLYPSCEAEGRVVGARGRGGAAGSCVAAVAGGTRTHGLRRDAAVSRRLCVLLDARRRFN